MAKSDTPGHTSPYGCGLVAGKSYSDKQGRTWIVNCFLSRVQAVRGFYYVEDPNGAYVDVVQPAVSWKGKRVGCSGFTKSLANYRDCKNKRCVRNLRDTGYNKNGVCADCIEFEKAVV
jgi:hypothetical protein